MINLPKIIALGGASAYAPENTLPAIHAAADMGIEWVAVDVKLTADGEAVLFRDDDLARTTGGEGTMAEMTLAQVQTLDAGSWYGDSFIGEKVPTLEEALDAAIERDLGVILMLRPSPGAEIETAEVALDVATRIWPEDRQAPVIASSSAVSLERALEMMPEWPRGLMIEEEMENWREMMDYLDAASLHVDVSQATETAIDDFIVSQKPVVVHGIDDPRQAQEMQRWGVDHFAVPNPDVIRETIETTH